MNCGDILTCARSSEFSLSPHHIPSMHQMRCTACHSVAHNLVPSGIYHDVHLHQSRTQGVFLATQLSVVVTHHLSIPRRPRNARVSKWRRLSCFEKRPGSPILLVGFCGFRLHSPESELEPVREVVSPGVRGCLKPRDFSVLWFGLLPTVTKNWWIQ